MKQLFTQIVFVGLIILFSLPLNGQRRKVGYYSEFLNNGKFVPYDTGIYEYNGLNQISNERGFYYNISDGSWIPYYQSNFTYNSNSDLDYYEWAYFNGTKWDTLYHYSHLYDANKNLIAKYTLRNSKGNWVNYSKEEYSYNSIGQNDTITTYTIDSAGNSTYSYQTIYTYNLNGNIDYEYNLNWNKNLKLWDSTYRRFYFYDANGVEQKTILEGYDPNNILNWVKIHNYTYTYDSEGLLRYWERYSYNDNKITNKGYNIYEFDGALSILTTTQSKVDVYPNPASQNTTFSWENIDNASLEIHDALGRLIFTEPTITNNAYTLNTTAFANGIYTYTISNYNGSNISSGLLIINK